MMLANTTQNCRTVTGTCQQQITHYVNETKSTTTEDGRRALVNNSSSGHNKEDCH